jgi:putative membrane protein
MPQTQDKTSTGVVDVTGAQNNTDPQREAVERADAAAKAFDEPAITDPTVFVKSAALGGMTEIELAKIAHAKSQDARVQSFAARLLKDHDALHQELTAIAKRKHLDIPTSLDYEDEQLVSQVAEKSGAAFDASYSQHMITEYQRAIALFQSAAKMPDPELAAFAKKTLPTLEDHQRLAIALTSLARP